MAPTRQKNAAPPPVVANGHDHGTGGDDITIENADTVVADGAPEVIETAADGPVAVEDPGVKALREQLDAEKRRAAAAEAALAAERTERSRDAQVITDSRLTVIDSAIRTSELKRDEIQRRIKEAKEAGDYDAETKAIAELTDVTLDLKQAKLGKDRLEHQIEEAKNAPQTEEDRLQAYFKTNNIHPKSQQWLRGHMDYLTDPVKGAELNLAHTKAVTAGNAINSDGYFRAIEDALGLNGAQDDTEDPPPPVTERRQAAPAAPVSRSAPAAGATRSPIPGIIQTGQGKYQISNDAAGRAIREAAEMSGLTVAQYVQEALKLQRGSDGQLH